MRRSIDSSLASENFRPAADEIFRPATNEVSGPAPDPVGLDPVGLGPSPSAPHPWSLRQILPSAKFIGGQDVRFTSVAGSTDHPGPGQLVVYRAGQSDPLRLISDAMARGVAGIVTEQLLPCPLPQCVVGDVESAAAAVRSTMLGNPDRKMLTIGVVGSAGKSTTALLIATLVRSLGVRTAYQTDLGSCDGIVQSTPSDPIPAGESMVLWLGAAVDVGCEVAILEIAEEPLRRGALDTIRFDLLVVTGSIVHRSDFGPSALQCAIERLVANGAVVTPADDPRTLRLVRDSGATAVTYGVRQAAEITIKVVEQSDGMTTSFLSQGDTTAVMESTLCGGAMAANHAAAATVGVLIGQPLPKIAEALGSLRLVPGRLQQLPSPEHANILIDAGGTPQRAIEALRTARGMRNGGRLWCVLGLDGSESPEELARYGELLERFTDHAVVSSTPSGKPRFLALAHQVLDGVKRCAAVRLVADHQHAVQWAVRQASTRDTVLLLGGIERSTAQRQRAAVAQLERWATSEREQLASEKRSPSGAKVDSGEQPSVPFRIVG